MWCCRKKKLNSSAPPKTSGKPCRSPPRASKVPLSNHTSNHRNSASTPGLVISPSLEFKPYSKPRPAARHRSKHVYSDSELLLHSTSHSTVDYTAREGIAGQDDSLRHYVGIYDPDVAEVSLVEV